ncbi:MAG: urease accessory UreF family protein [Pseudomonadota bacterium]
MATDEPMATDTETAAITLAQWFSPAYPVGAFHFSHGLEAVISSGYVIDAKSLKTWIESLLLHGSGRNDALFLAAAYHAADFSALSDVDSRARAFAGTFERRQEAQLLGAAFGRMTGALIDRDLSDLTFPVAVGRAVRLVDLPLRLSIAMYLQSFAANLVSVGQRLIPIGQTEGQAIVRDLAPRYGAIAAACLDGNLDDIGGFTVAAEIASMQHETLYSRVFRT